MLVKVVKGMSHELAVQKTKQDEMSARAAQASQRLAQFEQQQNKQDETFRLSTFANIILVRLFKKHRITVLVSVYAAWKTNPNGINLDTETERICSTIETIDFTCIAPIAPTDLPQLCEWACLRNGQVHPNVDLEYLRSKIQADHPDRKLLEKMYIVLSG